MALIGQKIGFCPNWPHLATEGGPNGVQKSKFRKSDFTTVQNFQKGPFPANMAMIGQKIGFGPDWPQLAHLGGQKGVLELTFTKSDFKFQNN